MQSTKWACNAHQVIFNTEQEWRVHQQEEHTPYNYEPPLTEPDNDPINPNHYKLENGHEVIEVTENLNGNGAQAVNYIARSTRSDGVMKGDPMEDLRKARWFIDREIDRIRLVRAREKQAKYDSR